MSNLLEVGLLGGGAGGGLEAYIATTLPNVPAALRASVAASATASAAGNGYTGIDVINELAGLYSWTSWEQNACFSDLAMTTLSTVGGDVRASRDFMLGTAHWSLSHGSPPALQSDKSILFSVNGAFTATMPTTWTEGTMYLIAKEPTAVDRIFGWFASYTATSTTVLRSSTNVIITPALSTVRHSAPRSTYNVTDYEVMQIASQPNNYRFWIRNDQRAHITINTVASPASIVVGLHPPSNNFWRGNLKMIAFASTFPSVDTRTRLFRFFQNYYGTL